MQAETILVTPAHWTLSNLNGVTTMADFNRRQKNDKSPRILRQGTKQARTSGYVSWLRKATESGKIELLLWVGATKMQAVHNARLSGEPAKQGYSVK
jgi:hypothetical protein